MRSLTPNLSPFPSRPRPGSPRTRPDPTGPRLAARGARPAASVLGSALCCIGLDPIEPDRTDCNFMDDLSYLIDCMNLKCQGILLWGMCHYGTMYVHFTTMLNIQTCYGHYFLQMCLQFRFQGIFTPGEVVKCELLSKDIIGNLGSCR